MGTCAIVYIGIWVLLMGWASARWYPTRPDRIGHFLYQMFLLAVFLLIYFGHGSL
jgi:hypothetical protein